MPAAGAVRVRLLTATALLAWGILAGCVDLTEHWQKKPVEVSQSGAGGAGIDPDSVFIGWPDGGGESVALPATGGATGYDAGERMGIDSSLSAIGGSLEAGLAAFDAMAGAGAALADTALLGTGGAAGTNDGGHDVSLGGEGGSRGTGGAIGSGGSTRSGGSQRRGGRSGSGGTTRTGGRPGTGGTATGGVIASGGAPATGGLRGTGGAATPDAAPDSAPDLLSGLVAYYPCEGAEADGITLPDLSGKDNHGTLASKSTSGGGTSFAPGAVGKALVLSKNGGGYVSLPLSVFAGAADMTIAVWVKVTTEVDWQKVLDVGVSAGIAVPVHTGLVYMYLAPKTTTAEGLAFGIATDGIDGEQRLVSVPSPGPNDGWTHVAVVLGPSSATLYVDGEQVTDPGLVALRPKNLGAIDYAWLGRSQFTNDPTFDGAIDEVRIYRRALSATEVKALYAYQGQ